MKAIRVHRYGPPAVMALEEVARPIPGTGEVLVRVEAAGVGPWDSLVRTGQSTLGQRLPLTPGSDIAGAVAEVGSDVSTFVSGDLVYGSTNAEFTGGYAQYAVAKAAMLAPMPRRTTFIEAAGVPVVAVTAWQMLFELAKVLPGQTVLVTGAAGSVGGFVLQFARWHRARAIAVISSDDAQRVRDLGAEEIIDLRVRSLGSPLEKIDVVIDTSGGDKQREAAQALKPGGKLVSSVSQPDPELMNRLGTSGKFFIVDVTTSRLERIARMIDQVQVAAHVGTVLALDEARIAHEMMAGERPYPRGKIVLDVNRTTL
jgi:NADPH:quinone reductase-like Zn-dependent oxidoreductase